MYTTFFRPPFPCLALLMLRGPGFFNRLLGDGRGELILYKDAYDLEVTCASDAAMQAYLSGVNCALRFDRPGINELQEAVAHDDEFSLAHATLARQLLIHGFKDLSKTHMEKAVSLAKNASKRERRAILTMNQVARFKPGAIEVVRAHVDEYPQDVFVLAYLLGPFGMLAFSGQADWCEQNLELLRKTQPEYREDDWWHITTRGFFAAEAGQQSLAREECERAWSIEQNGNCAHTLAHCHFEADAGQEGRTFLENWLAEYGDDSDMRHHMHWHVSLLDLEDGVPAGDIYKLYDRELDHTVCDPMPLTTFSDNASFLWRSSLSDIAIAPSRCEALWEYAEQHYPRYGFGFADIHRIMAASLHPDPARQKECANRLHDVTQESGSRMAECLEIYAQGFHAYNNGSYDEAVEVLAPALADSVLLGGSNPQRRVIEDTYLAACLHAGRQAEAQAVVVRRDRKNSSFDQEILQSADSHE